MSLSTFDRVFNDAVCIDHFFPVEMLVLNVMDTPTRYSAGRVVSYGKLEDALYAFEMGWLLNFWPPNYVHADGVFRKEPFITMLNQHDVLMSPVPTRGHQKNMIEPTYSVVR